MHFLFLIRLLYALSAFIAACLLTSFVGSAESETAGSKGRSSQVAKMISVAVYNKILTFVNEAVRQHRMVTVEDAFKLSISYESLTSLYSQVHLRFAEQTFHK